MELPTIIENVVKSLPSNRIPHDTVIDELNSIVDEKNISFAMAVYMLGFGSYQGF